MRNRKIMVLGWMLGLCFICTGVAALASQHHGHTTSHTIKVLTKGGWKEVKHHSDAAADAADASDDSASEADTGTPVSGSSGSRALDASLSALDLELSNGTVEIKAAPAGSAAQASWEITPSSNINAAASDTLELIFDQQAGGKLKVHDKYTGPKLSDRPKVHLTLTVPASVPVEAALGNGKLSIDSNAKLSAALGNGTLTLTGAYPSSEISVGNGKLTGDVELSAGKHDISVGNGSIDLALRSGSSVKIDAGTGIGGITLTGIAGKVEHAMMSQTATGTMGAGAGTLSISVGNGGVKLRDGSSVAGSNGDHPAAAQ